MQFSIKTNFAEVQRKFDALHKDIAGKAMASALNKTVAQAKTAMSREIRAEFTISASKVNQALRISKARASGGRFSLEASLESPSKRGRSLNLVNFSPRQTSKGVTVKIKKGGPRKLLRGAFIANEGRTVFVRTGEAKRRMSKGHNAGKMREPIKALQTIDVAMMFNTKRISAKVLRFIEVKFPELFAHEAKFFTDKFNRGA